MAAYSDTALVIATDLTPATTSVVNGVQTTNQPDTASVTLRFTSSGNQITFGPVPMADVTSQFVLGSTVTVSFTPPSTTSS